MALSVQTIVDELSALDPTVHVSNDEALKADICNIYLFKKDTDFSAGGRNALYIGRTSDLPARINLREPQFFILLHDDHIAEEYYIDPRINIIEINDNADIISVFNRLQDLFAAGHRKERDDFITLMDALSSGVGLQQIMELGFRHLNNPIMLCDRTFTVISHIEDNSGPDDPMWSFGLARGNLPEVFIDALDTFLEKQRLHADNGKPCIWTRDDGRTRLMVAKVTLRREEIGYLQMLESNRPFVSSDLEYLAMFSNVISEVIQYTKYGVYLPKSPLETFVINLLSNAYKDNTDIYAQAHRCNWTPKGDIYVLIVSPKDSLTADSKLTYYKKVLHDILKCDKCVIYKRKVCFIMNKQTKEEEAFDRTSSDEFSQFLQKENLKAYASRTFHDLTETHKYYKHIKNLMEIDMNAGGRIGGQYRLLKYDDHVLDIIIELCANTNNLLDYCHPLVMRLEQYDKENHTNYEQTLYEYLKHSLSSKTTANDLFIHYNTMKYRLVKLQEIFDIDFEDGSKMFQLWFSFKVKDKLYDIH